MASSSFSSPPLRRHRDLKLPSSSSSSLRPCLSVPSFYCNAHAATILAASAAVNCAGASFSSSASTRATVGYDGISQGFSAFLSQQSAVLSSSSSSSSSSAAAAAASSSSSSHASTSVHRWQLSLRENCSGRGSKNFCASFGISCRGNMGELEKFSSVMFSSSSSSSSRMPWLSGYNSKCRRRCRKNCSCKVLAMSCICHIHYASVKSPLFSSSSSYSLVLRSASTSPSSLTASLVELLPEERTVSSEDKDRDVPSSGRRSFSSANNLSFSSSDEERNVWASEGGVCSADNEMVPSADKETNAHVSEVENFSSTAEERKVSFTRASSADKSSGVSSAGKEMNVSSADKEKAVSSADNGVNVSSAVLMPEYKPKWSMLLSTEALEDAQISRAGSVTDAHVLRRKGRLKEQDGLIEFIISMHVTHSPMEVMEKMERWVREHFEDPRRSTLKRLVPSVERFYSQLPLVQALREYDQFSSLSRRKYVPPNFAEVRHVLNIAQVHAIAENLTLITFDADGTLYADGHHIERDNKMIDHIIKLMQHGANVAIVTAAGYPGEPERFETRFAGLLAAFEDLCLPREITSLFHIIGGECNYLLEVDDNYHLKFVQDEFWKSKDMLDWLEEDIQQLLSDAELALKSAAARLRVPIDIIRKPRAVGVLPKEPTIYEVLEEMALTVQLQLVDAKLPFCAFNGGTDVFVDVGNKSLGMGALMAYLEKKPIETLHVGDRFTLSGNDSATRSTCPILWVANPEETSFYTRMLLRDIRLAQLTPYIE